MNNEMKFEKNGLLIPNGALEELGLVGISLSAWLGQDHILLMPQEMTALQLLHALEGLSRASVELLGVLQEACRMPCAADCEKDMEDVPQVPDSIQQTRSHGKRNATEENERCTSSLAAMRPLFRRRCLTKLNSFGKHEKESQRCFTTLFQGRYAVLAEHVFGRRKSIKNGIGAAAIMKRDTNVRLLLYQKSKFRNPSAAYTTS